MTRRSNKRNQGLRIVSIASTRNAGATAFISGPTLVESGPKVMVQKTQA